jgi:hypothetical protein
VRYARRDAALLADAPVHLTGYRRRHRRCRYRPWSFLDLFARYENVQIDDPFTVPGDLGTLPPLPERQIALTFTNRGTAGLRLLPWDWLTVSYQLTTDSRENDTFAARSQSFGNSAAVVVTPIRDLTSSRATPAGPRRSRPTSCSRRPTGRRCRCSAARERLPEQLRWDFRPRGPALVDRLGRRVRDGRHDAPPEPGAGGLGAKKFFDSTGSTAAPFLELHHRWLEPGVEFRMIDYTSACCPRTTTGPRSCSSG